MGLTIGVLVNELVCFEQMVRKKSVLTTNFLGGFIMGLVGN